MSIRHDIGFARVFGRRKSPDASGANIRRTTPDKSPAITALRLVGRILPGDWLKTAFFLNFFARPRALFRFALNSFYRMEHIYDVLREAKRNYKGRFTILEFGTNEGYSLLKMLYATRYLGMESRVTVHGFDSFQGMPAPDGRADINIVADQEEWAEGQFSGSLERLEAQCAEKYSNYELHPGFFEDSLTPEFLQTLASQPPILVWIDCDFYSSTRTVMERLIPWLPNGCVVYFDEFEFNYGSRFTGEARVVYEINQGRFGEGVELIFDSRLSLDSRRVYRFVRYEGGKSYDRRFPVPVDTGRSPTNGSPLP